MKSSFHLFLLIFLLISCTEIKPRGPVSYVSHSEMKESISINRELLDSERELIKELIERDSSQIYSSSSLGFWKLEIRKATRENQPQIGNLVRYTKRVYDILDNPFYKELDSVVYELNLGKQEEIIGVQEALQTMNLGEKSLFLFPSYKAYGLLGDGNEIGVNTPLKIEIELIEIK
jgi:gliding motility-associated peptidyl-prolyl isomerase